MPEDEKPYEPKYNGFDKERTKKAHETADRAQETAGAKGEDANKEYMDDGPAEYKRRTGRELDTSSVDTTRATDKA